MAHKSPFPDFHMHLPQGIVDIAGFCASFVLIAAAAALSCWAVHWS